MLMMKKTKNLEFEPVHPKNVLLASVAHGISCLFDKWSVLRSILSHLMPQHGDTTKKLGS
jgi:hypothetical protein